MLRGCRSEPSFFSTSRHRCDSSIQPSGLQSVANATLVGFHQHKATSPWWSYLSDHPWLIVHTMLAGRLSPISMRPMPISTHPKGYTKRINFNFSPLKWVTYPGAPNHPPFGADQHLMVRNWDIGSTQPGSSWVHSLIANNKIIGVLSGGFSECHNTQSDYSPYSASFGTPMTTTRLRQRRHHLRP